MTRPNQESSSSIACWHQTAIELWWHKGSATGFRRRLTNSQKEDKHTYYDICPWSADQRTIVFSSADASDLTIQHGDNLATRNGEVYLMDTENDEISKIADEALFTTHNGTHAMWHPKGKKVYF